MSYELVQRIGPRVHDSRQPEMFSVDVHVVQGQDSTICRWIAFFAPVHGRPEENNSHILSCRSVDDLFRAVMLHVEQIVDTRQRPVGVVWTYEGDSDRWSALYQAHGLERLEPSRMRSRPMRPEDFG